MLPDRSPEPAPGPCARLAVIAALFSLVFTGCAAPGEPTARHPVVPQPVKDLAARQQGNGAVLTFTLPTDTTDKKPLTETPAVDIYRSVVAPAGTPPVKSPSRPVDTIPADLVDTYKTGAHIEFRDELDATELARQPDQQLTYTVRTRLSGEHASVDSNPAKLTVYPAPPPASELHATLMEKAVALSWSPPESAPGSTTLSAALDYRVYRAEAAAGAAATGESSKPVESALQQIAQVHSNVYLDTTVAVGHTYRYVVRAVAKFGEQSVESLDSNAAVIAANDIFPPAAPQNLVAVIIPATNDQPTYVELSWSISPEADLAGYQLFRSTQPDTQGEPLNGELLSAPTFRDVNVGAGQRYFYYVRAVDQAGNQSPFSAGAEADLAGR
jgi:hypothetical protein